MAFYLRKKPLFSLTISFPLLRGSHFHLVYRFFKKNFFLSFLLRWVFVAAHGLSLVQRAGATLHCGARASHCGGFSCCRARASVVVARGLSSCGSWDLERRLSIVAHGLSCSAACGIFPDQRSNLCALHRQADS